MKQSTITTPLVYRPKSVRNSLCRSHALGYVASMISRKTNLRKEFGVLKYLNIYTILKH